MTYLARESWWRPRVRESMRSAHFSLGYMMKVSCIQISRACSRWPILILLVLFELLFLILWTLKEEKRRSKWVVKLLKILEHYEFFSQLYGYGDIIIRESVPLKISIITWFYDILHNFYDYFHNNLSIWKE